jgi:oligoendopeptidase F
MRPHNSDPSLIPAWQLDAVLVADPATLNLILDEARLVAAELAEVDSTTAGPALAAQIKRVIRFQYHHDRVDTYRRLVRLDGQPLPPLVARVWQTLDDIQATMVRPILAAIAKLSPADIARAAQESDFVARQQPWLDINRHRYRCGLMSQPAGQLRTVQNHRQLVKRLQVPLPGNDQLSLSACRSILNSDPNPDRRYEALAALNRQLQSQGITGQGAAALQDTIAAQAERAKRSNQPVRADHRRNQMNGLSHESVDRLHDLLLDPIPNLVADHAELKRRLLGRDRLRWTDLYGPVPEFIRPKPLPYTEAKGLLIKALQANRCPTAAALLIRMGLAGQIDARPRPDKPSGASCTAWSGPEGSQAFIRLNWFGTERNLDTLAHEFGHALRHHWANQAHGPLLASSSMLLSETAAFLMEALLFDHRREQARAAGDRHSELRLTLNRIDALMNSVVHQLVVSGFERALHARATEPNWRFSTLTVSRLWTMHHRRTYRGVVDLAGIEFLWAKNLHLHRPFAVYGYAAAELLAAQLLRFKSAPSEDNAHRWPQVLRLMLANGQSRTLRPLLARLNLDPEASHFWVTGLHGSLPPLLERARQLMRELHL